MRHFKSDVSHRMRRRPSIFSARWFRLVLGAGAVVVLALWLGPPVAEWLRGQAARPAGAASRPTPPTRGAEPRVAAAVPRANPVAAPAPAGPTTESPRAATAPPAPGPGAAAPTAPAASTPAGPAEPARAAPSPPAAPPPARAARGTGPFRIQVGAFRDPANAARLAERLRADGVEVAGGGEAEESLYRLRVAPTEGEAPEALAERLRGLGHGVEVTPEGMVLDRPLPLRAAIEATRQLREQSVRVTLDRVAAPAGLRIVRVGAYATAEEAERARAELAARGYPGFVVRDR